MAWPSTPPYLVGTPAPRADRHHLRAGPTRRDQPPQERYAGPGGSPPDPSDAAGLQPPRAGAPGRLDGAPGHGGRAQYDTRVGPVDGAVPDDLPGRAPRRPVRYALPRRRPARARRGRAVDRVALPQAADLRDRARVRRRLEGRPG